MESAHFLLFFLAFVFGSFCTFCFHMLMYLFDEKCILFPKLLSMSSLRHNFIYEYVPSNKDSDRALPVDFVSTQWVDKSTCYLPSFVPLVSGIFGLVWITMFLMCSTGSRTLTGLQRPWRVLPPVFIFSIAMSGLSIYSSIVTHSGLQALCLRLGELSNSTTCTYTINVATLVYERRIYGVYQATRLTIITAWLHTSCWILSALLALARVLMAVDFQLVKVNVELRGDIERMLETHEKHIRTVSPDIFALDEHKHDYGEQPQMANTPNDDIADLIYENKRYKNSNDQNNPSKVLYVSNWGEHYSEMSLVPSERNKLVRQTAYQSVTKDMHFIVNLVYSLVDSLEIPESSLSTDNFSILDEKSDDILLIRQYGQEFINRMFSTEHVKSLNVENPVKDTKIIKDIKINQWEELPMTSETANMLSSSDTFDSSMPIGSEIRQTLETTLDKELIKSDTVIKMKLNKKSNLRTVSTKFDKSKTTRGTQKVHITESTSTHSVGTQPQSAQKNEKVETETQTPPKEKQD